MQWYQYQAWIYISETYQGFKDTMPRLRGAAIGKGDLSRANVGWLVGLLVDEASLGLPERHRLAHAEACPCHVAALLGRSVAICLSSWVSVICYNKLAEY